MVNIGSKVRILDVLVSRMGLEEALVFCQQYAEKGMGGYFCFGNVHTVTDARGSVKVRMAMKDATLVFADGIPLAWVARLKGEPITSRVSGPDFMHEFLVRFPYLPQAFVGGAPGLAERLAARYGIEAICYSPPIREFSPDNVKDDLARLQQIHGTSLEGRVVWVGLGAPKQELWMQYASALAPKTMFFGVGAAFDFLTEIKRRAPMWMQNFGLEWFYRLLQEPSRLAGRYFKTNLKFIFQVLCEVIRK